VVAIWLDDFDSCSFMQNLGNGLPVQGTVKGLCCTAAAGVRGRVWIVMKLVNVNASSTCMRPRRLEWGSQGPHLGQMA
jgi:hypothetical protein